MLRPRQALRAVPVASLSYSLTEVAAVGATDMTAKLRDDKPQACFMLIVR